VSAGFDLWYGWEGQLCPFKPPTSSRQCSTDCQGTKVLDREGSLVKGTWRLGVCSSLHIWQDARLEPKYMGAMRLDLSWKDTYLRGV
jgi:hypothetical protein